MSDVLSAQRLLVGAQKTILIRMAFVIFNFFSLLLFVDVSLVKSYRSTGNLLKACQLYEIECVCVL